MGSNPTSALYIGVICGVAFLALFRYTKQTPATSGRAGLCLVPLAATFNTAVKPKP